MKYNLNKIAETIKLDKLLNDKRVVVFMVCLLIATALWFLNALSKDYSTSLIYPVKYVNPPSKQFLANTPPDRLELKVNAHGFTLLRHKLSLSFSPIVLKITNITKSQENLNGKYNIRTNTLIRQISDQVSNEIQVTDIRPDYIQIVLDSLASREVPVKANYELQFREQFNLRDQIKVEPTKIRITGPARVLDTIRALNTEFTELKDVNTDVTKSLDILHPDNVTLEPKQVILFIPVEKYTEKEIIVPVKVINTPEGRSVKLFPSTIKLSVLTGLSEFKSITAADFDVFVDFSELTENAETLPIQVHSKKPRAKVIRYRPENIEFLIETQS